MSGVDTSRFEPDEDFFNYFPICKHSGLIETFLRLLKFRFVKKCFYKFLLNGLNLCRTR